MKKKGLKGREIERRAKKKKKVRKTNEKLEAWEEERTERQKQK